jgi:hypothetical protein
MRLGGENLDALIDFVARSNAAAELDETKPDEQAQNFKNQQADTSSQLKQSIKEATVKQQKPAAELLTDVKVAVDSRELEQPRGDLAEKFEKHAAQLTQPGSGFDHASPSQQGPMPKVFEQAVAFLRQPFVEARPKPQTEKTKAPPAGFETAVVDASGEVFVPEALIGAAEAEAAEAARAVVREFVQKYVSDGFEAAPTRVTAEELAQALPPEDRAAFLALPPADQKFLANLEDKHQVAYASLPKNEQALFRSLEPGERDQYLAMPSAERSFFQKLAPDERAAYLLLHADQRKLVRERGKEGLQVLRSLDDKRFASLAKKDRRMSRRIFRPSWSECSDTIRRPSRATAAPTAGPRCRARRRWWPTSSSRSPATSRTPGSRR